MKTHTKDHLEPGKNEQVLRALEMLDADEMVKLARRRYAHDFPNPQRLGCPSRGEIAKSADRIHAPDQSVLTHLLECSECYLEYRNALAQSPVENAVLSRNGWHISAWRLSTALIAVALIFTAVWFLRRSTHDKIDARNARATTTIPQLEKKLDREEKEGRNQTPDKPSSLLANQGLDGSRMQSTGLPQIRSMRIDLDGLQALRSPKDTRTAGKTDAHATEGEMITLVAARTRLLLRLPETGVVGDYTVSLVDAYDRILVSHHAFSPDGSRLRVLFDLRSIRPEKYRLRLSREGEAPAYYNVMIKRG